jgi:hypothetical protein
MAARLSALRANHTLPPGFFLFLKVPGTHFCWRLSRPQGHYGRKDEVNLKNPPHRDLNPRPSGLQHSALTTTLPRCPLLKHVPYFMNAPSTN